MATPPTVPLTAEERAVILAQLEQIMESAPFRSSKRYPAMLEHCVRLTLEGETEKLRERHLGMTLFSRAPGYETSSDPIVRMAASEIRKRLAQFYDIQEDETQVRISLPPGSYVAEFRFPEISAQSFGSSDSEETSPERLHGRAIVAPEVGRPAPSRSSVGRSSNQPPRQSLGLRPIAWIAACVAVLIAGIPAYRALVHSYRPPALWKNFSPPGTTHVPVVVGQLVPDGRSQSVEPDPPLQTDIFRASHYIYLGDASSAMRACSVLNRSGVECQLKSAAATDLSNIHAQAAVFVGAYNNPWVLRITQSLPYRFGDIVCKCILDSKTGARVGDVDFSVPRDRITTDYSIVARLHSDVTDGPAMIIAGIGPMSTEAAAEFASLPERSAELLALASKEWRGVNVEVVLATDVVNGIPGHTRILRTAFW